MEDTAIVDLYLKRDETAILKTSEKYGTRLRNIAYHIVFDHETTKECENDTYLKAWNQIPPAQPMTYLFAFLARIIRSDAIDRIRMLSRQKRPREFVELTEEIEGAIPAGTSVEEEIEGKELSRIISEIKTACSLLPPCSTPVI